MLLHTVFIMPGLLFLLWMPALSWWRLQQSKEAAPLDRLRFENARVYVLLAYVLLRLLALPMHLQTFFNSAPDYLADLAKPKAGPKAPTRVKASTVQDAVSPSSRYRHAAHEGRVEKGKMGWQNKVN